MWGGEFVSRLVNVQSLDGYTSSTHINRGIHECKHNVYSRGRQQETSFIIVITHLKRASSVLH